MSFGSRFLPPMTAEDLRRSDACKRSGCAACIVLGLPLSEHCGALEYHHRLSGGLTVGHRWGYALGRWHHQGFAKRGRTLEEMIEKYGPNLKDDKGEFHGRFGTDQALQNDQDDRIGVAREGMPSRRELRDSIGRQTKRKASRTARPAKCFHRTRESEPAAPDVGTAASNSPKHTD